MKVWLINLPQEIYNAANAVRSAIPHPRILGVIKECGGKMWMGEREWLYDLRLLDIDHA